LKEEATKGEETEIDAEKKKKKRLARTEGVM